MNGTLARKLASAQSYGLVQLAVLSGFVVAVAYLSWYLLPDGGLDMRDDILPSLKSWRAPWTEGTPLFPWATLVLMPLRLFSARTATALMNSISVIAVACVIRRMGGNALMAIPVLFSPVGYWLFTTGQTDGIILASILLPAGYDLLLFWKPQVALHAFWIRVRMAPMPYIISGIAVALLSLAIWGIWPIAILSFAQKYLLHGWWNKAIWPYGVPLGLGLVYLSIKRHDEGYGVMASPLLSPYVNGPSYIGLLVAVASKWPRAFAACYAAYAAYFVVAVIFPQLRLPVV